MNETRIRLLITVFALAITALILGLARLSIVDHDLWRVRASENFTSFRGLVPQRGSILFSDGEVVSEDLAGYDVEFQYREFRRQHPIGAVVHGANLARTAIGGPSWDSPGAYGYESRAGVREAYSRLCELDIAALREKRISAEVIARLPRYRFTGSVQQDLRFYLAATLSGLTDWSWDDWRASFLRHDTTNGPIFVVLLREFREVFGEPGWTPAQCRAELDRRFEERVEEFYKIAAELEARHAADRQFRAPDADHEPWHLAAVLETARRSAENQADLRALSSDTQDLCELGDFWRLLAKTGQRYSTVRDWLRAPEDQREAFVSAFEELRENGRIEKQEQLEDCLSGADGRKSRRARAREIYGLKRQLHLGQYIDDVTGYEPPAMRDEYAPVRLLRQVSHTAALRISAIETRHPGFGVRWSPRRSVRKDLGGLGPYIGSVSPYTLEDLLADADEEIRIAEEEIEALRQRLSGEGALGLPDFESAAAEESNRRELRSSLERLQIREGRSGRSGVERAMDERLRGEPGGRLVNRDRLNHESGMVGMADVTRGESVTLTIDRDLQGFADSITEKLGEATQRALVVVDPQNGDILAISGFGRKFEVDEEGEDVVVDGRKVLAPRETADYDLAATRPNTDPSIGSVIKPLMALEYLTGLRDGRYSTLPIDFEECGAGQNGYSGVKTGRRFGCGHAHGRGSQNVVHALSESCNIFFYECWKHSKGEHPVGVDVAERLDWLRGRDRGQIPGLDDALHVTPCERPSGRKEMVRTIGYDWCVSALDVAHAYAMVATGRKPGLGLVRDPNRQSKSLGWDPEDLALVQEGLHRCVEDGTARRWGNEFANLGVRERAHAKTGTAFLGRRKSGGTETDVHNSWFATFLGRGADASLVVVAVAYQVEGSGAEEAAPMVVEMLRRIGGDPDLRARYLEAR